MKKLILFTLVLINVVAFSQVEKGDKELSFFGNLNAPTEGGGGNGSLAVAITQYLSPNFSMGTSLIMSFYSGPADYLDPSEGNTIKMTPFIGIFATYNFLSSSGKVLPYIGGEYTFSWVENLDTSGFVPIVVTEGLHFAGGKLGIKIFVTEFVNVDVNLKYQTLISGPEGYNAGNIGMNVGLGFILPRKK